MIHAGDREIMYVLSVAEPEDSLQLREVCLPVSEQMLVQQSCSTLFVSVTSSMVTILTP